VPARPAPPPPPPPPGNSLNGAPIPDAPPADAPPADATVPPQAGDGAVPAAPSAFNGGASVAPSVATSTYNPETGEYVTPDGQLHQVKNLAAGGAPKSWKDLLPI
jgi:hypothetical protein